MLGSSTKRAFIVAVSFAAAWILIRFFLPLVLPFLLGLLLAMCSEPVVHTLNQKLHFPRWISSAIGMLLAVLMLLGLACLVGALVYREMGKISGAVPGILSQVHMGLDRLSAWVSDLADRAPGELGGMLQNYSARIFTGGNTILDRASGAVLSAAGGVISGIPGGAIFTGTMLLASILLSLQLPRLRTALWSEIPEEIRQKLEMIGHGMLEAASGWLKAQLKLGLLVFLILTAGFLLLRIPYAVLCGLGVAVVDAVPILGTGTVLIPWAVISILQGETAKAFGLVGIYVTAMLARSSLEPKLVGGHLGMNPLWTLMSLYVGYRLWGIFGMIFAPILAVTAIRLADCIPLRKPKGD